MMKHYKLRSVGFKITILIISLFAATVVGYLFEYWQYSAFTNRLEQAQSTLRPGMTKDEVARIIGMPPDDLRADGHGLTLYWEGVHHRGLLMRTINPGISKGHYSVAVTFDVSGKVITSTGGTN